MTAPQVRANWMKFIIHCAKELDEPSRSRILSAIPEDARREIRSSGRLEWIPAITFVRLADAIVDGVGPAGARAFWRRSLHGSIEVPFIRPLLHGALFLWGDTPAALVRRTPQAWLLTTRNCGEFRVVETGDDDSIIFRSDNVVPLFRTANLLPMWAGGLEAQLTWMRVAGSVTTNGDKFADQGAVEFVVRWSKRT